MTDRQEVEHARKLLDKLDPEQSPARDPRELREIGFALRSIEESEAALRRAVQAARDAGYTWAEIGMPLGTTRQAAQARFGKATIRATT